MEKTLTMRYLNPLCFNFDEINVQGVTQAILDTSISEVGCIAPYLPRNISKDYPICKDNKTGSVAWNIYNDLVYEQQFTKEVTIYFLFTLYLIDSLDKEAVHCDNTNSYKDCCES